jgi:dipeptidyl aminopeptidase/acylaminoacyl peptidase
MRSTLLFLTIVAASFCLAAPPAEKPVQLPEYESIRKIENYATAEEYKAARTDPRFTLTQLTYDSDGLAVSAYVYKPAKTVGRLPAIVFNRGSWTWKEFAGEYLATFHRLGEAGFVVIAPILRGSAGAEGRDEMGGMDLDDVMNTVGVLRGMPFVDTANVFMYGESRGGMMTLQAIREHYPMRAAAVVGAFTELAELTASGARFEKTATMIWPDYAEQREAINRRRSALAWPEQIDVPLLIMHGGADRDLPPSHALRLATSLQALGKPYELVIRNGANHVMTEWRHERDAHAVEWFRRHMK